MTDVGGGLSYDAILDAAVRAVLGTIPDAGDGGDGGDGGEAAQRENLRSTLDAYTAQSDAVAGGLAIDDGSDLALGPDRARLYWAAVGDLLVFHALCLAELNDDLSGLPDEIVDRAGAGDLRDRLTSARDDAMRDLELVAEGYRSTWGARGGSSSALPNLDATVQDAVRRIVEDSTSHVIDAGFGALGALVPAAGWVDHGRAFKIVRSVARRIHLDDLFRWASKLLEMATSKLEKLFGPRFREFVDWTKESLSQVTNVKDRFANAIYQVADLQSECARRVTDLRKTASGQQLTMRADAVHAVVDLYDKWSLGVEISNKALKWGGRLASLTPPVALAIAGAGAVVTAGSYLIGQYHLDWPEIPIFPWTTDGVLTALS